MSTKTTFKRIALVAVASLGFGVLTSVAPASAAEVAAASVTAGAVTTVHPSGRTGVAVSATVTWTVATGNTDNDTVNTAVAFVSKPATSTASVSQAVAAGTGTDGVTGGLFTMDGTTGGTATSTITFTPDVAGTYSVVAWHDRNLNGLLDTAEAYSTKDYTVVAGSDAVAAAITNYNSTSVQSGSNGALVRIALTNSAGAAASLGSFETIVLKTSGSAVVEGVSSLTLNRASFNGKGYAWVHVTDSAAEVTVLTVTGTTGPAVTGIALSSSYTFKAAAGAITGAIATSNTTGVKVGTANVLNTTAGAWTVDPTKSSTVGFKSTAAAAAVVKAVVTDVSGILTGLATAAYDVPVTADADGVVAYSAPAFTPLVATKNYTVKFGSNANDTITVTATASAPAASGDVTKDQAATLRAVVGSSVTLSVVIKDGFGIAAPNQAVAVSVSGRNAQVVTQNSVTDASGRVTFTYTDAPLTGVTATSDTVTFDGPSSADASFTVNYVTTLGVTSVKVTSPNTTAGVANTTLVNSAIHTGYAGAQATTAAVSAKVPDVNGSIVVGVPVTFTVSGTGAAVLSTKVVAYTDATGVATSAVYGWVAGTYTVTATAGAVSGTGSISFAQETATSARTISASAEGAIVTALVKDRFGNPVKGVTIYATKTGAGYFGNGLSSTSGTTNSAGKVEFNVTGGNATVTVSTVDPSAPAGTTYGQTAAAKGYDIDATNGTALTASAAGTSVKAEVGVGASYDAAGVASATADIAGAATATDAANAAADAAAEATDAANAATDAANAAAEAADAATAAAQDAADAVAALSTQVSEMIDALKKQITALTNLVIKIQKKVKA